MADNRTAEVVVQFTNIDSRDIALFHPRVILFGEYQGPSVPHNHSSVALRPLIDFRVDFGRKFLSEEEK